MGGAVEWAANELKRHPLNPDESGGRFAKDGVIAT